MRARSFPFRLILLSLLLTTTDAHAAGKAGYYRFPALGTDSLVFTAEGDLWTVGLEGGTARRLTSHPGAETHAAIAPDGEQVAFSATYEGPTEVYVMPRTGGLPTRLTYEGGRAHVAGWTPDGRVLYSTRRYATLPNAQLLAIDPATRTRTPIPLERAADGVYEPRGQTLFFTRFGFHGSYTKRYRGGTAQSIWRFNADGEEATPLTASYPGTSTEPMWWQDRIYFVSDRDGTRNLWSMTADGGDLTQHTQHDGWDVKSPSLAAGRIAYQLGADLHLFDIASGGDRQLAITLASDFDQRRQTWVKKPFDYLTAAHLSPTGDRVALTARGQVFVAPVKAGRLVAAGREPGVRYRSARFAPDGRTLITLSDQSGEVELWRLDSRGVTPPEQLTEGGEVLRFDVLPAPDGKRVAYIDKDAELWLLELASGEQTLIASSDFFGFGTVTWSPDSRWLAYSVPAANFFQQIKLYNVEDGSTITATSDRFDSDAATWSPDGRWLYFLSNRNLVSLSRHPWGPYQPGPFLDRTTKIYQLALRSGLRAPFAPPTELEMAEEDGKKEEDKKDEGPPEVVIEREGLAERLWEVPVPPGNYTSLAHSGEHLYWLSIATSLERTASLQALAITDEKPKPETIVPAVDSFELSADSKKLLLQNEGKLFVADATGKPVDPLEKHQLALDGWTFTLEPRQAWRQMFIDAWRLQRDYFYDPNMHGVDWPAMREKYLPLVERVTDRAELSDIFGEMMGELAALHHFVGGGDHREGNDQIKPAALGAVLVRDEAAGGYRVAHRYRTDPDLPDELAPLARPGVEVEEGDIITAINGVATLSVADPALLLRNQAGRQVLLAVQPADGPNREVIVEPFTSEQAAELRYDAWEYKRRQMVDTWSDGKIGYVHLRAMGGANYTEWARHYFPVFKRQGLIVDVRHNRGGNIESWLLGSLIRKPWMWWQPRKGVPYRNMQYAFGGHMAALCNESTASDGEAFAEGFRRLGLGPVIGTRTWGGEIWLTSSNVLVDRGIATAAEFGVYGPEGVWLIEGHGVEPDIVVDNLPHATYRGEDAQLRAAVDNLLERIREDPPTIPQAPPYPDKSWRTNAPAQAERP